MCEKYVNECQILKGKVKSVKHNLPDFIYLIIYIGLFDKREVLTACTPKSCRKVACNVESSSRNLQSASASTASDVKRRRAGTRLNDTRAVESV